MKMNGKSKWASAIGLLVAVVGIGAALAYAAIPTNVTLTATPNAPGDYKWYSAEQGIPSYNVTATAPSGSLVGGVNAAVDSTAASAVQTTTAGAEIWGDQKAALSEGTHYVYFRAYDTQGNYTAWSEPTTFQVDVTSPTVSAPTAVAIAGGKIRVSGISGADPKPTTGLASGVSTYTVAWGTTSTFTVDFENSVAVTSGVTTTEVVPAAGTWYIRIVAWDAAGNRSLTGTASDAVTVDNLAPVVTVQTSSSTWTTASVTATITAVDTTSGVATVNYKIFPALDRSASPAYSTTATVDQTITAAVGTTNSVTAFTVADQGAFMVIATATDRAGNVSSELTSVDGSTYSAPYKWDNSTPTSVVNTTTPSAADGPGNTWKTVPEVSLKATDAAVAASLTINYKWDKDDTATVDATSGVAYAITPATSSADGTHTLTFWAVDGAGLVGVKTTVTYVVYAYPPVTTILLNDGVPDTTWYTTVPTATITATTTPDGKAISEIMYKMDASAFATYTVGFRVTDGTHLITAYAIDASGTVGLETTAAVKVDTIHPVVGLFTPATVYSSNPTLTVAVTETGSGFGTSKIGTATLAGGLFDEEADVFFSAGTLSFRFVSPLSVGSNYVAIVVTDAAGNTSAQVIDVVNYVSSVNVSATSGSHGSISPAGNLSVPVSTTASYTVAADQGYHIASLLVDGSPVSAAAGLTTYTLALATGTSNHAILATFEANAPITFTVTATQGANGSISPAAVQTVNSGASVDYVIAAAPGFHTTDVLVDGASVGVRSGYTFSNVTANRTISATFAADVTPPPSTFTITGTAGTHGSLSIVGAHTVAAGSNLTVNVDADAGYHIADVLVGGVSVGAVHSYTFTNVAANNTISATFAADVTPPPSTFTITGTAGANGTMSVIGTHTVAAGSNLTVIITPNTYYTVSSVLVDGVSVGAVPAYTFTNVSGPHTISVTFVHSARIWTALTFKSSPYTSYHGHKFVFSGKISPSSMKTGTRITIWMRKSGQSWRKLGTVYTNGYDNYSYTLYNGGRTHGKYYVRAKYAGNSVYANCYSPYKTVYIK